MTTMWTMRLWPAAVLLVLWAMPRAASADLEIRDLRSLHRACRDAEEPGRRKLYSVAIRSFRFASYDEDASALPVDLRRNLRALRGAMEIFPAGLEPVSFVGSSERAQTLKAHERSGSLRLGFFLGFDGQRGFCLIRPAAGVTTVRADLAFVELLDAEGQVVAREDTDRLSAWLDDEDAERIPGEGPRATIDAPSADQGAVPPGWRDASRASSLRDALSQCYAAARSRGASAGGRLYVVVRGSAGAPAQAQVMLSTVRDRQLETCISNSFGSLPAVTQPVRVTFPVRFAD